MLPGINPAIGFLGNRGIKTFFGLQLYDAVLRNIHRELFVKHNRVAFDEIVGQPKVVRRQRRLDLPDHVVFQHIARPQSGHGDVFLSHIGVHGSLAGDRRAQILNSCC